MPAKITYKVRESGAYDVYQDGAHIGEVRKIIKARNPGAVGCWVATGKDLHAIRTTRKQAVAELLLRIEREMLP